ncbi:hypothetical protein C8F01DRAFT_1095397 [Mycena amicta]|nr:hypothetical protein C8F01DRAFT_1095397 [Mycena amicta]
MREEIKTLLIDPEELANNIIFRKFLNAINYQVADYNSAFYDNSNPTVGDRVAIPHSGLLSLTLSSVAEDAGRTQHPWQPTEDGNVDFSATAFIESVLVAHVTISLIAQDLEIAYKAALVEFTEASTVSKISNISRQKMLKLLTDEAKNAQQSKAKKVESGKRKKEKATVDETQQMPKQKKVKIEELEKENVDPEESAQACAYKNIGVELTRDDYKPPPIKPARKTAAACQILPAPIAPTLHSCATRNR